MGARFDAMGIAVSDMAAAVGFYRLLGLSFPEDAASQGHVEAELPGGLRLMLDTEAVMENLTLSPHQRRPSLRLPLLAH